MPDNQPWTPAAGLGTVFYQAPGLMLLEPQGRQRNAGRQLHQIIGRRIVAGGKFYGIRPLDTSGALDWTVDNSWYGQNARRFLRMERTQSVNGYDPYLPPITMQQISTVDPVTGICADDGRFLAYSDDVLPPQYYHWIAQTAWPNASFSFPQWGLFGWEGSYSPFANSLTQTLSTWNEYRSEQHSFGRGLESSNAAVFSQENDPSPLYSRLAAYCANYNLEQYDFATWTNGISVTTRMRQADRFLGGNPAFYDWSAFDGALGQSGWTTQSGQYSGNGIILGDWVFLGEQLMDMHCARAQVALAPSDSALYRDGVVFDMRLPEDSDDWETVVVQNVRLHKGDVLNGEVPPFGRYRSVIRYVWF